MTELTYEQLLAVFEAAGRHHETHGTDHLLLDWVEFWSDDTTDAEWLAEPLIPARRSVALFAPGGAGKSLLALWISASRATGRAVFGIPRPAVDVLYLDYEMTRADLRERLEDMGYGPEDDLKRLHYALLPDLGPLDSREGGEAVVALAAETESELVVVDTFARAVSGEENDADTVRDWYRHTGLKLKNAGRAFARIDHAGKNLERGQRGTSAKNDDVDIVWQLTVRDGDMLQLKALKKRMQWVPDVVELQREEIDNRLGYRRLNGTPSWPEGTVEVVGTLERLAVPIEWGRDKVRDRLRENEVSVNNTVLSAALRYRKNHPSEATVLDPKTCPRDSADRSDEVSADRFRGQEVKPQVDRCADRCGQVDDATGDSCPPLVADSPSVAPAIDDERLF